MSRIVLKAGQVGGLVLGVAEHGFADEVGEAARLVVGERRRAPHQPQPVRLERAAERGVDVFVGAFGESQPVIEVQPADRNLIDGRIDLQDDAPFAAEGLEGLRAQVLPAQRGADGQVLHVVPLVGVPVVEDPDELVAAPDAVGLEMRVAESAVVTRAVPAFAVGEGGFVKRPCFGPALVRA